ncbi:zinc finger BED domain-containing protein 4-like [Bemisia tabaci]|uniref:zinc finger BED domain-containing protein 4-like n=1 Tax=Bemisia tabaci TaxID=7038 RepID=UPI003B28A579
MPAEADPQRVPSTATPSRQSQQPSRAGTPARNLSQPTMPATFNTSNSFKIGGARDKQLVNALMFMIAKDNEPFRIVEKEGFRYFCSVAVPQFQIPGKTKITYLMDKKFSELKPLVKDTSFKDIDYICITFDVWTDTMNHKSYLGITAHFMENGKLASLILNTVHLEERHLGVNIKNKVEETFKDWGLRTLQIVLVVTDGAANMVNAANLLTGNEDKHLHCIAHVLNLIAEVVLANPFLAPLLAPVKAIITASIQSYILSDELRDAQPPGEALKLMQSVITRWNSEFYMIQRFLKLKDYISGVLINHPDSVQMISARKVSELQEVMTLLEPLEEMTRHLSGLHYVTCSAVIPLVNCLRATIQLKRPESAVAVAVKAALLAEIDRPDRFGNIELNQNLMMAMILDPRFRQDHSQHPTHVAAAFTKISELVSREDMVAEVENLDQAAEEDGAVHHGLSLHHETIRAQRNSSRNRTIGGMHRELRLYLEEKTIPTKHCPITYWMRYKDVFPSLFRVAKRFLIMPATSVPSERLFSQAGLILTNERSRLDSQRLSALLFLNSLSKEKWNL